MTALLKKYKYFILSSLLHFTILLLVFFKGQGVFEQSNMNFNFNTNGSVHVGLVEASSLQTKAIPAESLQKKEAELGSLNDQSHIKSVIRDQSLLSYKAPKYPRLALLNKQQGEVIVRLLVEKSGEIKKIVIHKSSNYPLLDDSVLEVAKHWDIKRSLDEVSWVQVSVNFMIQ